MDRIVSRPIEEYAVAHSTPMHEVFDALREETFARTEMPQMQVGPLEGRLLTLLARMTSGKLAVEVGTFTGYSSMSIAEGLADDGKLIACDINPKTTAIAQSFWDQCPWGDRIELRLGPALETIAGIDGPIDLVFIDADKTNYSNYWNALVPKVRSGGLIIVDNVLWSGSVLEPSTDSDHAICALNDLVTSDDRVEHVLLTVRDGMMLARKR
ncbi:MAG: class I SAM-dependent methyltransferase [Deltaproteobacteria bacterium]|nr:class I SAM-dependent methyltransferase [Deltaproteobacteria bacterium]